MNKTTSLAEQIERIIRCGNYVNDWGVWAIAPFTAESDARQGQLQFENGGILDEMEFFASHSEIIDAAHDWCQGDPNAKDCPFEIDEIVNEVIDFLMSDR